MKDRLYLSPPHMCGREQEYVSEAFASNWIAPLGPFVNRFEQQLCNLVGQQAHLVALNSGTAALHLAIKCLKLQPGDVVFCSDVTFAASCNPILYEHCVPVFIDSDEDSWNMSPPALKKALETYAQKKKLPKAVVITDLYGLSAKHDELRAICNAYQVPIIEDAAEALGAKFQGKPCGTFGEYGVFSFNSNKVITTSGGGALLCQTEDDEAYARYLATQARAPVSYYLHKDVGYNYRLSNICAAIGCGQLTVLDEYIKRRCAINQLYRQLLDDIPVSFAPNLPGSESIHWLTVMLINPDQSVTPEAIIQSLARENIEARNFWNPMHRQPVFQGYDFFSDHPEKPVGDDLFQRGICLPSGTAMSDDDVARVAALIRQCF